MKRHRRLSPPARAYLLAGERRALLQRAADLRFRVIAGKPERYGDRSLRTWIGLNTALDRARRVIAYRFVLVYNAAPKSSGEVQETPT